MSYTHVYFIGIILFCQQLSCQTDSTYDNHVLLQVIPNTPAQLEAVATFQDPSGQLTIFKPCRDYNDTMDILVPPERMEFVASFIKDTGVKTVLKHKNYGRMLDEVQRKPRRRLMAAFSIFEYHSYASIIDYLQYLARKYPKLMTLQTLGRSYNGRVLKLVKISTNPEADNPVILIDAGIHAREWVAPAMALYIIHRLVTDPEAVFNELNGVDWYIMPLTNPDGYEYTRTSQKNRLWRKTRSKSNTDCYGVDGNRNFGYKFGFSGVSNDPCDKETYAGPKPFSEPETQIVRNVMMEYANKIKLYVSLHAYGQYLVYPWGYTGNLLPKRWRQLDKMARAVSDAVVKAGGQPFKVMSAGKWYPAAGASDDFAFGSIGVPYSYTMEITDGYEFIYPEHKLSHLLPVIYEGFKVFGKQIKREFGRNGNSLN